MLTSSTAPSSFVGAEADARSAAVDEGAAAARGAVPARRGSGRLASAADRDRGHAGRRRRASRRSTVTPCRPRQRHPGLDRLLAAHARRRSARRESFAKPSVLLTVNVCLVGRGPRQVVRRRHVEPPAALGRRRRLAGSAARAGRRLVRPRQPLDGLGEGCGAVRADERRGHGRGPHDLVRELALRLGDAVAVRRDDRRRAAARRRRST